jgi:hypothetical protein
LACEIGTYRKRITELEAESLDYKAKWLDACHNHKVVSENRDAAIAEAVSQRTVECAEDVRTELCAFDETGLADRCYNLCLALNAPPAPAYPFQKPCQCWTYHPSGNFYLTTRSQFYLNRDANYCEVCGAQRVKVD